MMISFKDGDEQNDSKAASSKNDEEDIYTTLWKVNQYLQ